MQAVLSAWLLFVIFMIPGLIAVGPRNFLAHRRRAATISASCWAVLVLTDRFMVDWRLGVGLVIVLAALYFWRFGRTARAPELAPTDALVTAGLVVVVAFIVQSGVTLRHVVPTESTPWYYAGLAEQTARNGGYPLTSPEWGQQLSFLRDYPYFTSLGAAASRFLGAWTPLYARIEAFRLLSVILVAWWSAEFLLALVKRPIALVVGMLVITMPLFSAKMSGYRPEPFACSMMFLFLANALGFGLAGRDDPLRLRRDWGSLVEIVLPLLCCLLSHGVVAAVALAGYVAFLIARLISRRKWRRVLVEGAVVIGGAMALYVAADAVVTGELTQLSNATAEPRVEGDDRDLSFEFYRAYNGTRRSVEKELTVRATKRLAKTMRLSDAPWWVMVGLSLASLVLGCIRRRSRTRGIGIALWALILALGGTAFLLLWDTYVPQRTGPSRIWPYLVVPCFAALALAASAAERIVMQSVKGSRTGLVTAMSACLALLLFWQVDQVSVKYHGSPGMREADYMFLTSLGIEPGAIILTNGFEEGSVTVLTGGNCYVGGVAPYSQSRAVLETSVKHMYEARKFFLNPMPSEACDMGIDYLLVGRKRWALGLKHYFPTRHRLLDARFDLVAQHPRKRSKLYRVKCPEKISWMEPAP